MREIIGDIWDYYNDDYIICITTNGTIKSNGRGVMGRGCAEEAKHKIPDIDLELGKNVGLKGNHVSWLTEEPLPPVLSFPVKHNWWERADLNLIRRSIKEVMDIWNCGWGYIVEGLVIPRPGCGNGGRDYDSEVKPLLEDLPDKVFVISK